MGEVYTEITLKNAADVVDVRRGFMPEQEIREMTVTALVDTGAATLFISEEMRRQLGLAIRKEKMVRLANNETDMVHIADPVEIHWKNRDMVCNPRVFSDSGEALLGAIPLEDMDLMVDPGRQEVLGRHGDTEIGKAVGVRRV